MRKQHHHTYAIVTTDKDGCEYESDFTGSFEALVGTCLRALQGRPNWQIDISLGREYLGFACADWRGFVGSVDLVHPDSGRPWSMGGVGA